MYVKLNNLMCPTSLSLMSKWNCYSLMCGCIGICMFLYGFFLIHFDNVKSSDFYCGTDDENNSNKSTNIGKIVIMVIDALRYDFLVNDNVLKNMPFTQASIISNDTCVFPCRVHLPTVTMPRIKALTVGTVPNFFDIVLNFGNTRLFQDNMLTQMSKAGKKIIFYGDDTWIKLFPDLFYRYEGTTSFFVSDFVEVDYNVTRNVQEEITRYDWDVMIMHYLGLDHIGHLEGPMSSKVPLKLQEMDRVVEKLIHYLFNWKMKTNQNYLMVICGDHGMKDTGGHGGSTLSEVMVPFVTFGVPCSVDGEISQVDVAVTLSTLFHVSIPSENVGKVIPGLLHDFSLPEKIKAFEVNAKQLLKNYAKISDESGMFEVRKQLEIAAELRAKGNLKEATNVYELLLDHLSSRLISALTEFDLICLYPAILLVVQALFVPVVLAKWSYSIIRYTMLQSAIILCSMFEICYYFSCNSVLCNFALPGVTIPLLISSVISLNTVLLIKSREIVFRRMLTAVSFMKQDPILAFLILGSMLQICSTVSTSFIEEEHMVWYFLWTTFLLLMFLKQYGERKIIILCLALLTSHRVLRKLNQTGDHWASLPDINDWFKLPNRIHYLSLYTILGLSWTSFSSSYFHGKYDHNRFFSHPLVLLNRYLDTFCLIMVYVYRAAVKEVVFFNNGLNLLSHRGISEIRIYSYALVISFTLKIIQIRFRGNTRRYCIQLVETLISSWMILNSLLFRTYNIILIGSLAVCSNWLTAILQKESNKCVKLVIAHHWLAHIYFFYQGNSNSLGSIDIAAGYIGQQDYNQFSTGMLIILSMYAMPMLAYLCMFRNYFENMDRGRDNTAKEYSRTWLTTCLPVNALLFLANFYMVFYMIIIVIHRNHLFIWSVFSPKLLYLAAYYVLLCPVIVILQICS